MTDSLLIFHAVSKHADPLDMACKYAAACRDLSLIRQKQLRFTRSGGVRDSLLDREVYAAVERVLNLEELLGIES